MVQRYQHFLLTCLLIETCCALTLLAVTEVKRHILLYKILKNKVTLFIAAKNQLC